MRKIVVWSLALIWVSLCSAQTLHHDTLTLGIDLTLGMPEDTVVKKFAESGYKLTKHDVPDGFKAKGYTSMWFVSDAGDQKHTGVIFFSSGRLASAMKELLPEGGSDVEFGRQLYFAMRDLQAEGNSHCTIQTETGEVPDFAQKTAKLQCGKKTIVIVLQRVKDKPEVVSLNEELGAS
jgi:hypothetical protein